MTARKDGPYSWGMRPDALVVTPNLTVQTVLMRYLDQPVRQARERIKQGIVSLDGKTVTDPLQQIKEAVHLTIGTRQVPLVRFPK